MWPLLVACSLVGAPTATQPADAEVPAVESTRVVVLVPSIADRRIADVLASVRANLPDVGYAVIEVGFEVDADHADLLARRVAASREAAAAHDARGVFWLDVRQAGEYHVYLYVPARGQLLRRRVPEAAQSIEAAIEAMWLIVRSGTLALAKGAEVAMEAVDPATIEASAPTPTAPPVPVVRPEPSPSREATRDGLGLWLSAAYLGLGLGDAMPWQSGGQLEVSYAVPSRRRVAARVGVSYAGVVAEARAESLTIARHELAIAAGIGGAVSRRVRLEGRLLPALDLLRWRAGADRGLEPAAKLATELLLRIAIGSRTRRTQVTIDLGAGADVGLGGFDFVRCDAGATACEGDAKRVALAPWRVRPRARAGLSLGF